MQKGAYFPSFNTLQSRCRRASTNWRNFFRACSAISSAFIARRRRQYQANFDMARVVIQQSCTVRACWIDSNTANAVAIQSDGKIVVAGTALTTLDMLPVWPATTLMAVSTTASEETDWALGAFSRRATGAPAARQWRD